MADQFQGKKVTLSQYEEFKNLHYATVVTWNTLFENQQIDRAELENRLSKSFYHIHKLITKILKDNNIASSSQ